MIHQRYAEAGVRALEATLAALGQKPIDSNPNMEFREHPVLPFWVVVTAPAAPPFEFTFGRSLDVHIGSFSEVYSAYPLDEKFDIQGTLERMLTSSVRCRTGKRKGLLEIFDSEGCWRTLKTRSIGGPYGWEEADRLYLPLYQRPQ